MRKQPLTLIAALFLLIALMSCAKAPTWNTDFPVATELAQHKNKNMMLVFISDDESSQYFIEGTLKAKNFNKLFGKDYVLAKAEYSATKERDSSSQALVAMFGVTELPAVYILSPEGYALCQITLSEEMFNEGGADALAAAISKKKPDIDFILGLINKVNSAEGLEKVKFIDELYEASPKNCRYALSSLTWQILELDEKDETGLLGKYEYIAVYNEAAQKMAMGISEGVAEAFVDIAQNGHLQEDKVQEAYFMAAYCMAVMGSDEYDLMHALLINAVNAAPENKKAPEIKNMLDVVLQMKEAAEQAKEAEQTLTIN